MRKIAMCALCLFVLAPVVFSGGRSDGSRAVRSTKRASAASSGVPRILAAYIVDDTGNKSFLDGMYLPQAAAAYFPTPFSVSAKARKLSFDRDMPYRVLSKTALSAGVQVYTIEAPSIPAGSEQVDAGDSRSYVFSFPRSALGREGNIAMQPGPFALERAIRIASVPKGVARLESMRYDETTTVFKASVQVSAQSINR